MAQIYEITEENVKEVFAMGEENEDKGNDNLMCSCSCCGTEYYAILDETESENLEKYWEYGRELGLIQDVFPTIPAFVRSGAIDKFASGFCICPKCSGFEDDEK